MNSCSRGPSRKVPSSFPLVREALSWPVVYLCTDYYEWGVGDRIRLRAKINVVLFSRHFCRHGVPIDLDDMIQGTVFLRVSKVAGDTRASEQGDGEWWYWPKLSISRSLETYRTYDHSSMTATLIRMNLVTFESLLYILFRPPL